MADHIPWAAPRLWGNEEKYVLDALRSTWISGGPYIDRFERQFATYCGVTNALAVANGTAALHLAYLAAGIGPGDEVIVPGFAFMAAANMAIMVGATPVFADVEPLDWCMSAPTIAECLTPRTRAIVPVETYGAMCNMPAIMQLAAERKLLVIEDAAEAIGSSWRGTKAGTFGQIGVFSFHATKTITTGEGGAIVTEEPELLARMRLLRSHGMQQTRYLHEVAGHNFRLTNLQAAIGCAQLEEIEAISASRRAICAAYRTALEPVSGVALQSIAPEVDPIVWAVAVRLDQDRFPQGRDAVMAAMAAQGIETRPGFYPASAMPHLYGPQHLPVSEALGASVLVLPSSPGLTDTQIARVCDTLASLSH